MATETKIEWCEHTDNLWHGCTKVHAGCDHCYAETLTRRWKRDIWGNDKPRMEIKSVWNDLKKQQEAAAAAGEMHRVFVGSMMDIFEKPKPLVDSKGEISVTVDSGQLRNQLFWQIEVEKYPNLIFLFLTKRPSNINKYIPESWKTDPPGNVMFGTSPCDQKTAETLIPQLLEVKGRKFLSCEPLLGPIDLFKIKMFGFQGLMDYIKNGPKANPLIDWVIVGGESGHHARPMHPDWVRSLRDQCNTAGVSFFFKQWGQWSPIKVIDGKTKTKLLSVDGKEFTGLFDWAQNSEDSTTNVLGRVRKKEAGRMLDGKEYSEFSWELFKIKNITCQSI
jgi:protein gp37